MNFVYSRVFSILAYLDLGTGSYILQVALASLLGVFWVVRNAIKRTFQMLLGCFLRRKKDDER